MVYPFVSLFSFLFSILIYYFNDFSVEFNKGEDPRLILSGQWEGTTPAAIALSPNSEIVVIAHGSSISFYSTIDGKEDTTIEDIFNGKKCVLFKYVH